LEFKLCTSVLTAALFQMKTNVIVGRFSITNNTKNNHYKL